MPQSTGQTNYRRKEISYFDGLNSAVASNIAKKEELMHCENVRSPFIGTIEKREGQRQVGTNLTATANHGVFYFNNSGTNTTGLYRSSKVSGTNRLYYLKSVGTVTFTGSGLNDATSGGTYTGTSEAASYTVVVDGVGSPNTFKWKKNSGSFTTGVSMQTGVAITLSDGVTITFAAQTGHTLNDQWVFNANEWSTMSGTDSFGYSDPTGNFDSCVAEGNMYLVNQALPNRYVLGSDGISVYSNTTRMVFVGSGLNDATLGGNTTTNPASFTVIIDGTGSPNTFKWSQNGGTYTTGVSITGVAQTLANGVTITFASTTGHTLNDTWTITPDGGSNNNILRMPKANLINYYKGRLYVADFLNGANRQKNVILRSSPSLGILALANNDTASGATEIEVTDTKYILPGETIDVRRGGTLLGTVTVVSVEQTSITVLATGFNIEAADELWVQNTFGGANKTFRWVNNPSYSGVNAVDYDTFKLASTTDNDAEEIKMLTNVGNVQIIGSNNNLAIWNDFTLRTLDLGIGCVSRGGYVKTAGSLFFLHYTGIYQTEGETPQLISTKVERYITGATKSGLESCVAGKKGRNIMFNIGSVTLRNPDGSIEKILSDVVLEYSVVQKNWYVHTNVKATSWATWIAPADPETLVAASTFTNYPVVEFLASGVFTDMGAEIHMRADTPNLLIGQLFEKLSYPLEVAIEMERGRALRVFVSLDMDSWYEIEGEAAKGLSILKIIRKELDSPSPTKCRNIRFSFRHSEKSLCKLSKVAVSYSISAEEETEREDGTQPKPNITTA